MCICLPNGKFNFKFTRSHSCTSKKDGKNKRTLSLISESSEEEEGKDKIPSIYRNGIALDSCSKSHGDGANKNGEVRQLSRDRQLPPVPDAVEFSALQLNSPRKSIIKNSSNSIICGKNDSSYQVRQQTEDYGSIYDSETYEESKSPFNKQPNQFPMTSREDPREIDPLYSSVIPHINKGKIQAPKMLQEPIAKEFYVIKTSNDHLYSTIVKKDFNSLRKPVKPHSSVRDYPYQSLQSLNNQAPGLPVRLYKLSELAYLTNRNSTNENDVKLRKSTPQNSKSSSLRRFSQPNSVLTDNNDHTSQISEENEKDEDVIRRIQSQYNTPPNKRASISDVRQLHFGVDISSMNSQCSSGDIPNPILETRSTDSNNDFYRHKTVRDSRTSLRLRNGHPENSLLFENPSNVEANVISHVYDGLYETLYYSSADPSRPALLPEEDFAALSIRTEVLPSQLPYLSQDNYLSITDNPLSANFHNQSTPNVVQMRPSQDRSSVIYAASGSEVYAEISDAYLSKQYEELPELKTNTKDNGQVNNGYASSPGTLRVLLEIQSFRHMDSDVDVSSRSTTPLHPFPRSIICANNKPSQIKSVDNNNSTTVPNSTVIRHPWFLPQRSANNSSETAANGNGISASLSTISSVKTKLPQNHLAIMTPLMERSMEGSSMFLDNDNRNIIDHDVDNLYDLFKRERNNNNNGDDAGNILREGVMINGENDFSSRRSKRITYPSFSDCRNIGNGDRGRPLL